MKVGEYIGICLSYTLLVSLYILSFSFIFDSKFEIWDLVSCASVIGGVGFGVYNSIIKPMPSDKKLSDYKLSDKIYNFALGSLFGWVVGAMLAGMFFSAMILS